MNMSADAVARWNAIPMQRPEVDSGGHAMKVLTRVFGTVEYSLHAAALCLHPFPAHKRRYGHGGQ